MLGYESTDARLRCDGSCDTCSGTLRSIPVLSSTSFTVILRERAGNCKSPGEGESLDLDMSSGTRTALLQLPT